MKGVANPSYRKRVGYQAGLLGGFATMAAVLLLIGDMLTRDSIAARQLEDLRESLGQVIPASLHDNQPDQDTQVLTDTRGRERLVYRALREGRVEGVAFQATGYGYAGAIELLLGVDRDGRLLGVRVLSHAETPGLGDKIEVARDDWILDFDGKSLGSPSESQWKVRKDGGQFEQFTGATITPRAVVAAVADSLRLFRDNREQLLAPPPAAPSGQPETTAAVETGHDQAR